MLLERNDKPGLVKSLYKSSNILASTYNPKTEVLEVIFKGGSRYAYKGVGNTDYFRFESAESQGKVMNTVIKPNREFEKLEPVDEAKIVAAVTNANQVIEDATIAEFINRLNKGIEMFEGTYDLKFILTVKKLTEQTLSALGYEAPEEK